jgi:EmrB/QacA subfamily drug resistance transporter
MEDTRRRWLALYVLCLGTLMIVLDSSIVNVALPSIATSLHFSQDSLSLVVNAYLLTFGGFLLLGGKLGDIYGPRRLFLIGISIFTLASLTCGISMTREMLIIARAVQGVGGAIASAVGMGLIMRLFTEPAERAKAMGITGFVASGGGAVGVFLGGVLTGALNWHWIFLVNLPIGIAVAILASRLVPSDEVSAQSGKLDVWGAVTVTGALMIAVYAIVNGNQFGWTSLHTLGMLAVAVVLMAAFVTIESRVASPLMPLQLFRHRNLTTANIIGVLWAGAMFAWFFLSTLYMQRVLGYSPYEVGFAFLPANIVMGILSIGVSGKLVMRYGIRTPLVAGLLIASLGLALFARAPEGGSFLVDVLPAMVLLGFGAGIAFNPVLLAAMGDVEPVDAGIASGIVNTSFMMGGALGLATLASIAAARTSSQVAAGIGDVSALLSGYHLAFAIGAVFAVTASIVGAVALRPSGAVVAHSHGDVDESFEETELQPA